MQANLSACILLLILLISQTVPTLDAQTFQDIAPTQGITQSYAGNGKGGGVSFYDFTGDGLDDLSFATGLGDSLIFFKNQEGTLVRVSLPGVNHTGAAEQLLWADYDNDGDADLFVTDSEGANLLYANQESGPFVDVTASSGLSVQSEPSYAACWGDYNRDGQLDLYVCSWGTDDSTIVNRLYKNVGDGHFEDMTERNIVANPHNPPLAVMFVDINHDLYPDIYIANDHLYGNTMYVNNGDDSFSDISQSSGTDIAMDGMGITVGDYDRDGDLDLYVSNSPYGHALLRNEGNETFTEVAPSAGVALYGTGWGVNFIDFDNDMDLDLYASAIYVPIPSVAASTLFENNGNGNFVEANAAGFMGNDGKSYGNAIGDLNLDGYYDIAVNNSLPDPLHIWKSSGGSNRWISLELVGISSNRDGIGSWVEVLAGGVRQVHYTHCGTSYLGQNSSRMIFGLGTNTSVDSIIVSWPSGTVDVLTNISSGSTLMLTEGSSPTSLDRISLMDHIDIFPNPSKDKVHLRWKSDISTRMTIKIMNLQGEIIWQGEHVVSANSVQEIWRTQDLPLGLYLIDILTDQQERFIQKLEIID